MADQITLTLEKQIKDLIPTRTIDVAARMVGELCVKLNLKRLNSGIDVNGNNIRKLTRNYTKWKYRYIKGDSYKRGKHKGSKLLGSEPTTIYKAKGVPNYGRLTGQTLADFGYKIIQKADFGKGKVNATIQLSFKSQRAKNINRYMLEMGRNYYGMAKGGAALNSEREALKAEFAKQLGLKGKVTIQSKTV